MPLVCYGINHKMAPVAVRECVAFDAERGRLALEKLIQLAPVTEVLLLSTCNRTEIYACSESAETLRDWLTTHLTSVEVCWERMGYMQSGEDAVRHLLRVATGLDSMVVGEVQILGQLKRAYEQAKDAGTVGPKLKALLPAVFSMAKAIRTQTDLGRNPVTMAYAVVQLARQCFASLSSLRVMLVGVSDIMELMATHFQQHSCERLIVANRTLERAEEFAGRFAAQSIRIGEIPAYLAEVDVLITATASQLPLIGKGMIERVMQLRKNRPLLLVDLAVPRDIEPQIRQLTGVHLFDIDDIEGVIAKNLQSRHCAAQQAEAMVDIQVQQYTQSMRVADAGRAITQFRARFESIRDQELEQALADLRRQKDPRKVVSQLAHAITQKALHYPTQCLRDAAYYNRQGSMELIKELFDLS